MTATGERRAVSSGRRAVVCVYIAGMFLSSMDTQIVNVALAIFALASALCAVSTNLVELVVARALQGGSPAGSSVSCAEVPRSAPMSVRWRVPT
jgi:MFS family permease